MNTEEGLLAALVEAPRDDSCWLALADWLEESGQPERCQLLRLRLELQSADLRARKRKEAHMTQLLAQGFAPPLPVVRNSLGMDLVLIPAGSFFMGSPVGEPGRHDDEDPRHRVEISKPFFLAAAPVTQGQYQAVMGSNPSHFRAGGDGAAAVAGTDTASFPVEQVSWDDAQAFCRRLGRLPQEKSSGRSYRLPTEAEWEYACRAGTTSRFYFGNALTSDRANIDGDLPEGRAPKGPFLQRTTAVGSYPANAFGLFDLHGNVWEWCADWFEEGTRRALRGGSWFYGARICRSAYRYRYDPRARHHDFGVRVAMDA